MPVRSEGAGAFHHPGLDPATAAGGVGVPPPYDWLDPIVELFTSSSQEERWRGFDSIERAFVPAPGPYAPEARMLAELQEALADGGRLALVPEAHLALAKVLVDRGDAEGARSALWRALRLAGGRDGDGKRLPVPYDRERASQVNLRAARIFARLGDQYQAHARWKIGRYFAATDAHRAGRFRIPLALPKQGESELSHKRIPMMGPRRPMPAPPRELVGNRGGSPSPPTPPGTEGRPAGPIMPALELLNELSKYIATHRRMMALAEYNRAYEAARIERDYLPVPPRPEAVQAMHEATRRALHSGSPEERSAAEYILSVTDFYFAEEAARAYWAVP